MSTKTKESSYVQTKDWLNIPVTERMGFGAGSFSSDLVHGNWTAGVQTPMPSYLSGSDQNYRCSSRIEYDDGPQYKDGELRWKRCVHSRVGFDRVAYFSDSPWCVEVLSANASLSPTGRWATTAQDAQAGHPTLREQSPVVCDREFKGYIQGSGGSLWNPASYWDTSSLPGPTDIDVVHALSAEGLVSLYFPDAAEMFGDYCVRNQKACEKLTDLNELLHTESLFYSNLVQAFPLMRLLAGGKRMQEIARWLSQWRSRFGRRPFLTSLRAIAESDLIYRFVIQTTISDIRDFMNSFDDVWKLFAEGQAANGRDWTRLAHRPSPMSWSDPGSELTTSWYLPTRPTLPSSGIDGTSNFVEYANIYDQAGSKYWQGSGPYKHGNNQFAWYGYNDFQSAVHAAFSASLGENNTVRYKVSPGFSFQRSYLRWVKVRYRNLGSLSPMKVWANRVGITRPLDSLWDLIPFSFVCDYFFRVGDWIEGISQHIADFKELRGDIIDAKDQWICDKWSVGRTTEVRNYDAKQLKLALQAIAGSDQRSLVRVPPQSHTMASASRFSRYQSGMKELCSQFSILSDKNLSSVRKRTLAELAFMFMDKKLNRAETDAAKVADALTLLKLESKTWRSPNKVIDAWSVDQFDEYLTRTLKQASRAIKARR